MRRQEAVVACLLIGSVYGKSLVISAGTAGNGRDAGRGLQV